MDSRRSSRGVRGSLTGWRARIVRLLDWDRRVQLWARRPGGSRWVVLDESGASPRLTGRRALQHLLRYSTGWYGSLFVVYHLALIVLPPPFDYTAIALVGAAIIVFMAPVPFARRAPGIGC